MVDVRRFENWRFRRIHEVDRLRDVTRGGYQDMNFKFGRGVGLVEFDTGGLDCGGVLQRGSEEDVLRDSWVVSCVLGGEVREEGFKLEDVDPFPGGFLKSGSKEVGQEGRRKGSEVAGRDVAQGQNPVLAEKVVEDLT